MVILGAMTLCFAYTSTFLTIGILFLMHGLSQGLYKPNIQS